MTRHCGNQNALNLEALEAYGGARSAQLGVLALRSLSGDVLSRALCDIQGESAEAAIEPPTAPPHASPRAQRSMPSDL